MYIIAEMPLSNKDSKNSQTIILANLVLGVVAVGEHERTAQIECLEAEKSVRESVVDRLLQLQDLGMVDIDVISETDRYVDGDHCGGGNESHCKCRKSVLKAEMIEYVRKREAKENQISNYS